MAYEDVPDRLLAGEAVPASEIIGYAHPNPDEATRLTINFLVLAMLMEMSIVADVLCYSITPFGQTMRIDFVKRIEGDCPECPEEP